MYIHTIASEAFSETKSAICIAVCLLLLLFLGTSTQLLEAVIGMMFAFNLDSGTYLCIYTYSNAYICLHIHTHMKPAYRYMHILDGFLEA